MNIIQIFKRNYNQSTFKIIINFNLRNIKNQKFKKIILLIMKILNLKK